MVRAPLPNINQECLLWQIDVDELWTESQLCQGRELFLENPEKTAAWYWCHFFVGLNLIVSSRNCYSQNPNQEWLRTWKFKPGMQWVAHEPPILALHENGQWKDVGRINPLSHEQTEDQGLIFQHHAYTLASQLEFKESYYGYKNALERWQALQKTTTFPVSLKSFFPWVSDGTTVAQASSYGIYSLLAYSGNVSSSQSTTSLVLIDGVFFQLYKTGIARLWTSLLHVWSKQGFAQSLMILDRARSAPRIEGIRYIDAPAFSYDSVEADRQVLQDLCDREKCRSFHLHLLHISNIYPFGVHGL
ncbi:MAG: hypothetical protein HC795_07830 [Coleofasciculaceae cyanobacterium RL_1_1]|nr:hypothetical protein [Coleofasciculaceae cyanobacterium RL_1_1]